MIVRDEAELLPEFLRRARGLWDELRVVDTGSADATPRLLAEAGATVLHAPWTGDFAEARNRSLEGAAGDWIAVLDADEMVSEAFVREARGLLADGSAGAATLRMLNRLPHGHAREARLLRLFRNDPAIRFRHAIHEDASEAVAAHLAATGRRLVHLEGAVDHLGYVRARAAARDKKARDTALLEKCLAADPHDLYAHLKLLEQARFWGDRPLWARAAARARDALDAARERLATTPHGGELLVLAADGLFPADAAAALAWLDARAGRAAPSAALLLRRGEHLERLGRLQEAAAAFVAARALAPVTANLQLATVRPLLGLARLAIARGALPEARARVDEALALAPRDPEALLAAVTLASAAGGGAAVRALAAAHAGRHGESEELLQAVGEGALRLGDRALALEVLGRAAPGRLLAVARLADGDHAGARAAAAAAPEDPGAALAGLLSALAEGRDGALELDVEPAEAQAALRGIVALFRPAARPEVREALRRAAPALAGPFPWLPGAL